MTLIVKELIVRGIVNRENSPLTEISSGNEVLSHQLEQLKKEIEKECMDRIMQKLETKTSR
jgi:hypothetical protein